MYLPLHNNNILTKQRGQGKEKERAVIRSWGGGGGKEETERQRERNRDRQTERVGESKQEIYRQAERVPRH